MLQQAHGFQQQVVEVQRVGLPQTAFVLLVNHRDFARLRVGRGAVEILRRLPMILGVADPAQRRAVLHELLVQAGVPEDRLDHRQLLVFVIDGEGARETRTQARQRVAVPPQHTNAERVKGGQQRPGPRVAVAQQLRDPLAHLVGGLVREGHRQHRGRGDFVIVDETEQFDG